MLPVAGDGVEAARALMQFGTILFYLRVLFDLLLCPLRLTPYNISRLPPVASYPLQMIIFISVSVVVARSLVDVVTSPRPLGP